jgi:hypothetical protein
MSDKDKNKWILIFVLSILTISIILALAKVQNKKVVIQQTLSPSDALLNQATKSDTTDDINTALNKINVDDTSTTDLQPIDNQLNNL